MDTAPASATDAPDATAGLACMRCGYDLRGLPPDGRCPECGLSVARSAAPGDLLRHAPPGWLASLTWGARLLLAVPPLAYAAAWLLLPRLARVSLEAYFAGQAAFGVAFAAGVWLLTRPQRRFGASGPALRWSLRVVALGPLAQTVLIYAEMSGRLPVRSGLATVAVLGLAPVPLPALLFTHLRRLALRVLDASLAEHCTIVGVGFSLTLASAALTLFARVPFAVVLPTVAGVLLFLLWSLYLMLKFANAFARARRASARVWGAEA